MLYWHTVGNSILTWLSNVVTNLNLTDMETGYKAFRRDVIQSIRLKSNRFGFEPEVTAKIARRGYRIYEVPISYRGRDYWEGKKINWRDGVSAIWTIFKYGLFVKGDSEAGGYITLERMGKLSHYNNWIWESIAPWVGDRVLEVGAGTGNMTRVMYGRDLIVATDIEVPYLHVLRNRFGHFPSIRIAKLDLNSDDHVALRAHAFDTVVCLNVLEHIEDDEQALRNLYDTLIPGGRLLLYVPEDPALYGTMDKQVGHFRRYSVETLRSVIESAGFTVDKITHINRLGRLPWWFNGRVLRRVHIPSGQSRVFDFLVPMIRRIEGENPKRGLSLVAVATKPAEISATESARAAEGR